MKSKLLAFILILTSYSNAVSQIDGENIYVYRNDGRFNAFSSNEVDSIRYSNVDLSGEVHPDVIVQEICTSDSIYRIPLSVIDSISIKEPITKYADRVIILNPDYKPYVESVDGMTIHFSNSLPHSKRIARGDILFYDESDDTFPYGFAGKVVSIVSNDDILSVSCEKAALTDIFEEYVAVGDYYVERDPDNENQLRAVPIDKANGLTEFKINPNISLSLNSAVNVEGDSEITLKIRTILNVHNGNTYVEISPSYKVDVHIGINANKDTERFRVKPILFSLPCAFPSIPILKGEISIGTFLESKVTGKAELNATCNISGGASIRYENGHVSVNNTNPSIKTNIEGEIGAEGYVWTGVLVGPGIYVTGRILELKWVNSVGPSFDFDVNMTFNGENSNTYERLKDSEYSTSLKLGTELQYADVFMNHETTNLAETYAMFCKNEYYLLPEFADLKLESDKSSISATVTAKRNVLIPCEVGLRIIDNDGKILETWYSDTKKDLSNPNLSINHVFKNGIKAANEYTVSPVVKIWGVELQASPEAKCYTDMALTTGKSYASVSSLEAMGSIDSDLGDNVEVGFVITQDKTIPTIDNARVCKGELADDNTIRGDVSGLKEGTTYYYRVYAKNEDNAYYGNVQCITTKRNIDKNDDDNFGGGYTAESKPIAQTGQSFDVEMKSAIITLTFDKVSQSTECGYFLQADSKRVGSIGTKYYSLGTVTGNQTVELKDLIPGTTYHYWAVEKNGGGESVGKQLSFDTEPSPDPVMKVVEIKDVDIQKATVSCIFENIELCEEYGIEYIDGDFAYKEKATSSDNGSVDIILSKLTAETEYTVRPYAKFEGEAPMYDETETQFTTSGPDVTGWWIFNDGFNRIHDLELRANGRSNTFYGVNYLTWERSGNKIKMLWGSNPPGTSYWEYRGEFNEDFTRAKGTVVYVTISESLDIYDENFTLDNPFYLFRKQ